MTAPSPPVPAAAVLHRAAAQPLPHVSGHVVCVDPTADGGWRAWCLPHGDLVTDPSHLAAFIVAVEHDRDCGGDTT